MMKTRVLAHCRTTSDIAVSLLRSLSKPEYYVDLEIPQGMHIKPIIERKTYESDRITDAVEEYRRITADLTKDGDKFQVYHVTDAYVNRMMRIAHQNTAEASA